MAANDEPVHFQGQFLHLDPANSSTTYAELRRKWDDIITKCREINAEVLFLEEKIMALKDTFPADLEVAYETREIGSLPPYTPPRDVPSLGEKLKGMEKPPARRAPAKPIGRTPSLVYPSTFPRSDVRPLSFPPATAQPMPPTRPGAVLPPFSPTPTLNEYHIPAAAVHIPVSAPRVTARQAQSPRQTQPAGSQYGAASFAESSRQVATTPRPSSESQVTVRQHNIPIIDTSVLGVMHTTRYDPRIYASRGQQRYFPPPTLVRAHEPVVHSPSRSLAQLSSPQPGRTRDSSNSLCPAKQNAPSIDTVLGVIPPTTRCASRYTPRVEQQSHLAACARSIASHSVRSSQNALGTRKSHSGQQVHQIIPAPSDPERSRRARLDALLENGPDKSDSHVWRFESHGLYNPQNMCFRNASLQGLVHTSMFAQLFLQLGDVLNRDEFGHIAPLVHATIEFIRMFYHKVEDRRPEANSWVTRDFSAGFYLNPTKLSDALANALPRFFTSQPLTVHSGQVATCQSEEDCGEFLVEYLSVLNVEFDMIRRSLSSSTWNPSAQELRREYDGYRFGNTKETAVYRLFSTLISETPEFLLRLPITETVFDVESGIQTCFRQLGRGCYFEQLPAVLVIQLGRWVFDRKLMKVRKTFKPIRVDTVVDVPSELIAPYCSISSSVRYQLVGVVNHHGRSAVSGHYTADMRHPGHDIDYHRALDEDDARPWLRMNDRTVSTVPRGDVLSLRQPITTDPPSTKTAYVLFYERV